MKVLASPMAAALVPEATATSAPSFSARSLAWAAAASAFSGESAIMLAYSARASSISFTSPWISVIVPASLV